MENQYNQHIIQGIKWVNTFLKGESKSKSHKKLVDIRRKLKKIDFAFTQNPSATLYGESQVGKSYLVKNLLSINGESFVLKNQTGEVYDFLKNINPDGNGHESTSVVTRFTVKKSYSDEAFPIKISFLSPKDVALIVIDTYFQDYVTDKDEKLRNFHQIIPKLEAIESEIASKGISQSIFTEDDIYDIKEYIDEHFYNKGEKYNAIVDSGFWEKAPLIISKLKYNEWHQLIGIIWGNIEVFSDIFTELVTFLHELNYPTFVHCGYDAILKRYGTILDVNRLIQLDKSRYEGYQSDAVDGYKPDAEILLPDGKKVLKSKNKLCAVSQEVIFYLGDEIISHKPFLDGFDILDFPGAQPRIELSLNALKEDIGRSFLRGKVGFLFNKYASEYLINTLLFCNQSRAVKVAYIPTLLNQWIEKYIGKNASERESLLVNQEIDPLFIIYTYFNSDLKKNQNSDESGDPFDIKWSNRFKKNFQDSIVSPNFKWDKNWTISNPIFKNHYMLRDFLYSEENGLFNGYIQDKKENIRLDAPGDLEYWGKLEKSFVENTYVKEYFKNPQKAWDESATLNNDGSKPIIENLTIASKKINRNAKLTYDFNLLIQQLKDELRKHYHDDASEHNIYETLKKAQKIHLDLDTTFSRDKYFFGRFMRKFILRESQVFNLYNERLNQIEIIEITDPSEYSLLLLQNPQLSSKLDYNQNIQVLINNYNFDSIQDVEDSFKSRKIDLNELFYGNEKSRIKNNSSYLSTELKRFWFDEFLTIDNFSEFIEKGFSENALNDLLINIKTQFTSLEIDRIIAFNIRKYVDRYDKIDIVQIMIADISAGIINKFINRLGFDFYSLEKLEEIEKAKQNHNLELVTDHDYLKFESMDEESLGKLLETIDNLELIFESNKLKKEAIKNIPSYSHFIEWSNLLDISFVANCNIPTYDLLANSELKKIIEECER